MTDLEATLRGGRPILGTYTQLSDPTVVDLIAESGLQFVRFDALHVTFGDGLERMIDHALSRGLWVWLRTAADDVESYLDDRVGIITVPSITSAAQVEALGRTFEGHTTRLGCQLESLEAIDNLDAILRVPSLSVVHTGRNDLTKELGLASEFDAAVLDAERAVLSAAIRAGIPTALHVSVSERGISHAEQWIEQGVSFVSLDIDRRILRRGWQRALSRLAAT